MKFKTLAAASLALATAAPAFAVDFGYTVATDNFLYEINLTTGIATRVGLVAVGLGQVEGLAFVSPGVLIGIGLETPQSPFAQIWNLSSPPGSVIVQTTVAAGDENGLAAYQGQAYPVTSTLFQNTLFSVDLNTALTGLNEPIDFGFDDLFIDGLAINSAGTIYGSDPVTQDSLFTIALDGTATVVGNFGLGDLQTNSGLDFNSQQVLYMLLANGNLYTVSTADGVASAAIPVTFNGNPLFNLGGFAIGDINAAAVVSVPEPTTVTLGLLGLTALTLLRRERR